MSVLDLALLYHSVKIRRGTDKQLLIMILLYTSLFYFSVYLLTFFFASKLFYLYRNAAFCRVFFCVFVS